MASNTTAAVPAERSLDSGPKPSQPDSGFLIRQKLFEEGGSDADKYQSLVTGRDGRWALCKYELVTTLFGPVPGALGLVLRRRFYRRLFKQAGRGLIIGRNVTIRHADNIKLGRRVVLDDNCLLDARGAGSEGLVIGDDAIINRGASVQCKSGAIHIGSQTNVGANSAIVAIESAVRIGRRVLIAGGCEISSGEWRTARIDIPIADQGVYSRGPVVIGDDSWLGMGVIVLDGVEIGPGGVVGAGAVVRANVPEYTMLVPHQKQVMINREGH